MRDDELVWEDEKPASDLSKHGVSFETARLAFADPSWLDAERPNPDEERFNSICMHEGRL